MRLLAIKSGPEIMKFLNNLEKESKAIIEDVATLAIYGAQGYDTVWNMSHDERMVFLKILKDKISLDRGIKPKETLTQELR
jgi:hypothetical protein